MIETSNRIVTEELITSLRIPRLPHFVKQADRQTDGPFPVRDEGKTQMTSLPVKDNHTGTWQETPEVLSLP